MVSEGPEDVDIDLGHVWGGFLAEFLHGVVHMVHADLLQIQHMLPDLPADGVRDALVHTTVESVCAHEPLPIPDHVAPLEGPFPFQLHHLLRDDHCREGVLATGGKGRGKSQTCP